MRSVSVVFAMCMTIACFQVLGAEESTPSSEDGQSPFRLNAGVKLYWNSYRGDGFEAVGNTLAVESGYSDTAISFVPILGIRAGNFVMSGSYLVKTDYTTRISSGALFPAERDELDVNLGWYILPSTVLTAGYKRAKFSFGTTLGGEQSIVFSGPSIGVAASAPITESIGMYSNLGYARTSASEFPIEFGTVHYTTLETGLSVTLLSDSGRFLKGLSGIIGYRFQYVETDDNLPVVLFNGLNPVKSANQPITFVSQGWILGFFGTF